MSAGKSIYRVLRSVVFTTLVVVLVLLAASYLLLSMPSVQKSIKNKAEKELSAFLGSKVTIADIEILPFNEVKISGLQIYDPAGKKCISVDNLGAGISLWSLLRNGIIEISYAEIISMDAHIIQASKDGPLNIDFIIKAFAPKEKKEPKRFDVIVRNVVIRKSYVSFRRSFLPKSQDRQKIDFNDLEIGNLNADLAFPRLKNDDFTIDVRRLAFTEKSGFNLGNLSLVTHITPQFIDWKNLKIRVNESKLSLSDGRINFNGFENLKNDFKNIPFAITLTASPLIISNFSSFFPPLQEFEGSSSVAIDLSGNLTDLAFDIDVNGSSYATGLKMSGNIQDLLQPKMASGNLKHFSLHTSSDFLGKLLEKVKTGSKVRELIGLAGKIDLNLEGSFDLKKNLINSSIALQSDLLSLKSDVKALVDLDDLENSLEVKFKVDAPVIRADLLTGLNFLDEASLNGEGNLLKKGNDLSGNLSVILPQIGYNGLRLENIGIDAEKRGNDIDVHLVSDNRWLDMTADLNCILKHEFSQWNLNTEIYGLSSILFAKNDREKTDIYSGEIRAAIVGDSPDNMTGEVNINNLKISGKKNLLIDNISIGAYTDSLYRNYSISSDFVDGKIYGFFKPTGIIESVKSMVSEILPQFVAASSSKQGEFSQQMNYEFTLKPADDFFNQFKIPVRPAVTVDIKGYYHGDTSTFNFNLSAPYLYQGKDKLIKNTDLNLVLSEGKPAMLNLESIFPIKNDYARLHLSSMIKESVDSKFSWTMADNEDNSGFVSFKVDAGRNRLTKDFNLSLFIEPSEFKLSDSRWIISPAYARLGDGILSVNNLNISNGLQFVKIYGNASSDPIDRLNVDLSGINLKYIFNILNINYVDFGGIATGKAHVSSLFTKHPEAMTDQLFVKDLSYNDCVLGDGQLEGHWDNQRQMVAINADITDNKESWTTVRGGVYVTRDSLSFDFKTKNVDVAFLKPIVKGFTSDIKGHASGFLKLYGTFSDIDLTGKAYADSVSLLVDYTNVYYSTSDSIIFTPGRISLPSMRVCDRFGNSCLFNGEVRHHYLQNAYFDFDVKNAEHLLVYDTGPSPETFWYGRVFANGNASLTGSPTEVNLNLNMSTSENSNMTFVLDETETATEYTFLTFSDKRKEEMERIEISQNLEASLSRQKEKIENPETPTLFSLNMALDVNPSLALTLVMDPRLGDKITAVGAGPIQMHYDTDNDVISIYGKYTISSGNYNFSIQNLILKNFTILEGSSISFNGDPLNGVLDINAAYRVNTNIADLDDSFLSDPDLKRTTVPVDAILKVSGDLESPDINFDISLPTVTADVQRRVKSIISTEDMLNQQVIYLLALNRFYSPEYTSSKGGGELASVASSTLSSQIQNIISSMTDKFSLSPSFKSDKDNFSDLEFDVALSSRLFDNRLLLNGNFGYRDKSTSQTTFVGDFDLEYLLTPDGRLRLKAYNHFNDASYYLRSSLTTQGIGIVYRRDFDNLFDFTKKLFRRKDAEQEHKKEIEQP